MMPFKANESFIGLPVPNNAIIDLYRVNNESIMVKHTDPLFLLRVNDITKIGRYTGDMKDCPFEIIGLKSEILKDEDLAEKVVTIEVRGNERSSWTINACTTFQSLCTKYNMEGEFLILKLKEE